MQHMNQSSYASMNHITAYPRRNIRHTRVAITMYMQWCEVICVNVHACVYVTFHQSFNVQSQHTWSVVVYVLCCHAWKWLLQRSECVVDVLSLLLSSRLLIDEIGNTRRVKMENNTDTDVSVSNQNDVSKNEQWRERSDDNDAHEERK